MAIIKEGTDSWLHWQIEFMEHGLKIRGNIEILETHGNQEYSEWGTCRVDTFWKQGGGLVFFEQSSNHCDKEGAPILEIHAIDERVSFGTVWKADRTPEWETELEAIWAKLRSNRASTVGKMDDKDCPF